MLGQVKRCVKCMKKGSTKEDAWVSSQVSYSFAFFFLQSFPPLYQNVLVFYYCETTTNLVASDNIYYLVFSFGQKSNMAWMDSLLMVPHSSLSQQTDLHWLIQGLESSCKLIQVAGRILSFMVVGQQPGAVISIQKLPTVACHMVSSTTWELLLQDQKENMFILNLISLTNIQTQM